MRSNLKDIGQRILAIRTKAGLTQADLGLKIGVKGGAVSKYEKGDADAGAVALTKIADIGGVSLDWLLTGEGEPKQPAAKVRTLEDLVREDAEEWPPSKPPSDFEVRVIGMLRRIGPKERQHILNLITNAYYDEVEGIKPKE